MHVAQAALSNVRSPARPGWTLLVVTAALAAAGGLSLAGGPDDARAALLLGCAITTTELLRFDLPDRRGVSLVALPALLAVATLGGAGATWAVGLGTFAAALLQRRDPRAALFLFARAVVAVAAAAALAERVAPGALGATDPKIAALPAIVVALTFAALCELASWVERRAVGQPNPSHVDVLLSVGLVPIALVAWALEERAGPNGALAAGGGMLAVLFVARAAVNLSTRHGDLQGLYELARQVEVGGSPERSVEALARGLPRWVAIEAVALALPSGGQLRLVAASDPAGLIPADWHPRFELERAAADGPTPLRSQSIGLRHGTHALAARYGRHGVLLLARGRPFRPDDCAVLGLLLRQLSPALEQVRLLDEIEQERQRLDVLFASSSEAIVAVDAAGRVSRVNPALESLVGRDATSLLGRAVGEAVPFVDEADTPLAELLDRVGPDRPLTAEGRIVDARGVGRDVLLSYASVRDAEGRQGGIGILHDVSVMKQAQRERDDFVNVMTHDLRQPLAGILGYAQLLERGLLQCDSEPKLVKYAVGVRAGGDRMLRMINNLLEIARMESGRIEIDASRVDVGALVEDAILNLEPEASAKGLALRADLPSRSPIVETSEPLLRESIANLVGNAVKYTLSGSVTIRVRAEPHGIAIAVADTGIGIPPEALPRLFGRFFRTGQPEVRQLRGSGLGLALTKMMIEKLGGTIQVDSVLGQGTTFTVRLPSVLPGAA